VAAGGGGHVPGIKHGDADLSGRSAALADGSLARCVGFRGRDGDQPRRIVVQWLHRRRHPLRSADRLPHPAAAQEVHPRPANGRPMVWRCLRQGRNGPGEDRGRGHVPDLGGHLAVGGNTENIDGEWPRGTLIPGRLGVARPLVFTRSVSMSHRLGSRFVLALPLRARAALADGCNKGPDTPAGTQTSNGPGKESSPGKEATSAKADFTLTSEQLAKEFETDKEAALKK